MSDSSSSEEEDEERPGPTILSPISVAPVVANERKDAPVTKGNLDFDNGDDLDDWLNGSPATAGEPDRVSPALQRDENSPVKSSPDVSEVRKSSKSDRKSKEKKSKRHHKSKKSSRESSALPDDSGHHGEYEEI